MGKFPNDLNVWLLRWNYELYGPFVEMDYLVAWKKRYNLIWDRQLKIVPVTLGPKEFIRPDIHSFYIKNGDEFIGPFDSSYTAGSYSRDYYNLSPGVDVWVADFPTHFPQLMKKTR